MKKMTLLLAMALTAFFSISFASAALLNMTGYETGDFSESIASGGTSSIQSTIVKSGNYAFRSNPTTSSVGWVQYGMWNTSGISGTSINDANLYAKFQFRYATKPATADTNEIIFSISTATGFTTTKNELRLNSTGTLAIYGENGFPLIATGTTVLDANTWYEIKYYSGTAVNAPVELKINNVVEISTTISDPDQNNNNRFTIGKLMNRSGQTVDFYYDDMLVSNSGYPASSSILRLDVDKNGSIVNWDDGNTANWTGVSEIPNDGNLTVIGDTGTNTHYVGFETTASAGVSGTINHVRETTYCRESVTATSAMNMRIKSDVNTVSLIASRNLTSAYAVLSLFTTTDPHTGLAWTTTALDSVEAGVVNTAAISTGILYCTSITLTVDFTATGASTCTYSGSGNWLVNLADNCSLTTDTNLAGNKFMTYGAGSLTLNAWFATPEAHLIGQNIHWLGKGFK